jgi:heme A synthase
MFAEFQSYINVMGFSSLSFSLTVLVLVVWSLFWKGLALWKAARKTDKVWYIVLLVVNTVGILEILYIYFFSKKKQGGQM